MNKIYKLYITFLMFVLSLFCVLSVNGTKVDAASYDSYYTTVDTSSGQALISSLTSITGNGYKQLGYSNRLSAYPTTDMRPGTNYIWDMYSNENYTINDDGSSATSEGQGFNTEHSVPQSWFSEAEPMRSDLFHIYPTDIRVNSLRGSYVYGETNTPSTTTKNGSKIGSSSISSYSGTVFEPIDEYKGDFARTYFYMATRYSSRLSGWTSGQAQKVFKGSYPYLTSYAIELFTKWHQMDPVSEKEISRNDAVYAIQKNRNPYIDHPEYVNAIWGDGELAEPTPSTYKVTYSCGTGVTFNYTDNTQYQSGSLISKPNVNPTKIGFEFVGWTANTNTRELWDFNNDKISKNVTLYPVFKASSVDAFTSDVSTVKTQLLANFKEVESNARATSTGYKKVTSASELAAGDKIVLANASTGEALSTTQNNNNRGVASVTISDGIIETLSSEIQVITLETGSVSGTYSFNVGNGYLYAASSSSNHLKTQSSINDNASFKIDIASDGKASIVAQGSSTRNILQYNPNSGSAIISCYQSSFTQGTYLTVYKETAGVSKTYEPTEVGIKFNYYVSMDIYNAFVDEYDFGFEFDSDYITDVFFESVTNNGQQSVKISIVFDDITNYQQTYSVKPVLINKTNQTEKAYGVASTAYSVKSLASYYLNTYSGNDTNVSKYQSLLDYIVG